MKEKSTLTKEQKEQLSAFIREVYDFNFKGGRVFLSDAGFAYQRLACSAKDMERLTPAPFIIKGCSNSMKVFHG